MISLKKFPVSKSSLQMWIRNYETLLVKTVSPHVRSVEINRPEKLNSMNQAFWREMRKCFQALDKESDCRAIVLSGNGRLFTSGLDLSDPSLLESIMTKKADGARKAKDLYEIIRSMQDSFTSLEKCTKPVIAAVHSACVGGGINMISAADIRYSTSDAWFQIKEPAIGMAADVGVLQRMPKIIGSFSLVCELAYTARKMYADEAKEAGFVSRVFPDKTSMMEASFALARTIAELSPLAVQGTKVNLNYSRDHTTDESLEYMARWNSTAIQSEDVIKSITAVMQKTKADYENY